MNPLGAARSWPQRLRVQLACLLVLFALPLGAARGAEAQATPRFLPDRDVTIQYTVTAPGQTPHDFELAFSAESQRLRIDDPERHLWFLLDLHDAQGSLVVPAFHAIVKTPTLTPLTAILESMSRARFTPEGERTIAGLQCTRYQVVSSKASGTACLTKEGIALALSGEDAHGSASAVADAVREAPVSSALLSPPAGFATVTLPPEVVAALLRH